MSTRPRPNFSLNNTECLWNRSQGSDNPRGTILSELSQTDLRLVDTSETYQSSTKLTLNLVSNYLVVPIQ